MSRTSILLVTSLALFFSLTSVAWGQTYANLHSFSGGRDGGHPLTGLTMDGAGNLYGTTSSGGYMGGVCGDAGGCGTVFRLSRKNEAWIFTTLYEFKGGFDGESPQAEVTIGPDGAIYGTTLYGGEFGCSLGYGCGIAFRLAPGPTLCHAALCSWRETIVYDFAEDTHGISTPYGGLTFDPAGNIYGTAFVGGIGVCERACGAVYKLTPGGGSWGLTPIYIFTGGADGASPMSTLLRDSAGDLYGTAAYGGRAQAGTVFRLAPSGPDWIFKVLYTFQGEQDGSNPTVGLVMDGVGNLYGTSSSGGADYGGVVFQLAPQGSSWNFAVLDSPPGGLNAPLNMDRRGNLYATTTAGGANGLGLVFELTPAGNGWLEHDLYSFSGADGYLPYSNVVIDNRGNLYGTASSGGGDQAGVVWQLTP